MMNMSNWKEDYKDIRTDSLWLIPKGNPVDKGFHGCFVPYVSDQLISRFTKEGDLVFDPFIGSGTTAYSCRNLNRRLLAWDIDRNRVDNLSKEFNEFEFETRDSCENISLEEKASLAIVHPPYWNIIKFNDNQRCLSQCKDIHTFRWMIYNCLLNCKNILVSDGHLAIVIADVYKNKSVVPLGFYCMQEALDAGLKLKGILIKDVKGNEKSKGKNAGLWRYRALKGGFYTFDHEYIFVFKKH